MSSLESKYKFVVSGSLSPWGSYPLEQNVNGAHLCSGASVFHSIALTFWFEISEISGFLKNNLEIRKFWGTSKRRPRGRGGSPTPVVSVDRSCK